MRDDDERDTEDDFDALIRGIYEDSEDEEE